MDDKEKQQWMDSLYPVGKERWVKLKYLDQKKAMQHIRIRQGDPVNEVEEAQGFVVTAMGFLDEFNPQVAAIMDLRGHIVGQLLGTLDQYTADQIDSIFLAKIAEIKNNTINYAPWKPINNNQLVLDEVQEGVWQVKQGDSIIEGFGNDKMGALEFIYNRSKCLVE